MHLKIRVLALAIYSVRVWRGISRICRNQSLVPHARYLSVGEVLEQLEIMDKYQNNNFDETLIDSWCDEATDWANTHGIVMRNNDNPSLINPAPFTLFPSPFPAYLYKEAFEVHKAFQSMMHKCSNDHEFLQSSLKRYESVLYYSLMG